MSMAQINMSPESHTKGRDVDSNRKAMGRSLRGVVT